MAELAGPQVLPSLVDVFPCQRVLHMAGAVKLYRDAHAAMKTGSVSASSLTAGRLLVAAGSFVDRIVTSRRDPGHATVSHLHSEGMTWDRRRPPEMPVDSDQGEESWAEDVGMIHR